MAKLDKITDEIVLDIINCAKDVFCDGIYVPYNSHPCGWDFISFNNIDSIDDSIDICDISRGIYEYHNYEDKTVKEILKMTQGRYAFELSGIDW